ncbi:MAG: exodeoxyribonuclease III [Gammaproteobacteria bacterium RIFCSPHIGHO2_12_FULL_45_12]|nr:MAG: exodeoxyribonuclease III [Gammaproteobacteria bacterium RIFCSPHIGHO2_12_FULL_45_12]
MDTFTIATWNVNSLRVRLPHVLKWLSVIKPDVLALQEIKMPDSDFPVACINQAGYQVIYSGQRTYNGVAILSRAAASQVITDLPGLNDPQRRVLGATINGLRILNLYVPNGESVTSDKYQYKLGWIKQLDVLLKAELQAHHNVLVLGDFNIAPAERDVHDATAWEGHVLFTQPERQAFQSILRLGFKDCFREQHREEAGFSWWDYRMNAFKRHLGMRIDHILASEALYTHCIKAYVDQDPRAWERPSDHAPVIAEFNLA